MYVEKNPQHIIKQLKKIILSLSIEGRQIIQCSPGFYWREIQVSLTIDHSLALWPKVLMLTLSAYTAPINAPMLVPPTMSTGISASTKAFSIPTCDRPLKYKNAYCMFMKTWSKEYRCQSGLNLPSSSPSKYNSNRCACQEASQAWEIRHPVCFCLHMLFIQLNL